jgi:Zn-dependent protease
VGPYLPLGRVRGVALRVSWTAPIGALAFGGLDPAGAVAWLVVVSVHEIGHAALARRFGRGVTGISLHAFGGECEWIVGNHRWGREIVAWGGVLAQLALFTLVLGVDAFKPLVPVLGVHAFLALTGYNLFMALFNLAPIGNFDGRRAWPLLAILAPSNLRAWWRNRSRGQPWGESRELRRKLADRNRRP